MEYRDGDNRRYLRSKWIKAHHSSCELRIWLYEFEKEFNISIEKSNMIWGWLKRKTSFCNNSQNVSSREMQDVKSTKSYHRPYMILSARWRKRRNLTLKLHYSYQWILGFLRSSLSFPPLIKEMTHYSLINVANLDGDANLAHLCPSIRSPS
jgi:hypothetical protein